ncbi:MAG: PfaD family polyunsaturated fatty acid/polyketide biosynthesis protein [bacterium]|nr:PfaD family polyunsaturated fatty acid/polyketide biosynthesis protein [bacterium]
MQHKSSSPIGWWLSPSDDDYLSATQDDLTSALLRLTSPLFAVQNHDGSLALTASGQGMLSYPSPPIAKGLPLLGFVPALPPESLGDSAFRSKYSLQLAYVSGSMANGIASEDLVAAMAQNGMLGFFGSAGLALDRVEGVMHRLRERLGTRPYGFNLIHSPHDPALEAALVELFLKGKIRLLEASAFMSLTLPLLRFRYAGISLRSDGTVYTPNSIMAKVSRLELAQKFLMPAPDNMLRALVESGDLTTDQAALAAKVPVCSELTAEADSGGHTDNRPAVSMWPSMLELRDSIAAKYGYSVPVGAAGGISTPVSAAAAFAMGAAYVMTGSVNQACSESGTCEQVREVLAKAGPADCTMAPAADMFEMGVNVQVLKWGTMFPVKARKLYGWYRQYSSFQEMPKEVIAQIERDYLRCSIDECWSSTREFFAKRDPRQIAKAEQDPKHLMALVFRSYLGQASRWANSGDPTRRSDYQIWCGPAMGAFNEWVKGSFLENPLERHAANIALNIMTGAAVASRADMLRKQGIALPAVVTRFAPRKPQELEEIRHP